MFHVKSILRMIIRKLFILWVVRYIVLIREKWSDALHLKDTFAIVHHRNLIGTHQVFATMSSDEFKKGKKITPLH